MLEEHTAEPWMSTGGTIFDGHGIAVATRLRPEDSRRILACVNACWGIPTETLERGSLNDFVAICGAHLPDRFKSLLVRFRSR